MITPPKSRIIDNLQRSLSEVEFIDLQLNELKRMAKARVVQAKLTRGTTGTRTHFPDLSALSRRFLELKARRAHLTREAMVKL